MFICVEEHSCQDFSVPQEFFSYLRIHKYPQNACMNGAVSIGMYLTLEKDLEKLTIVVLGREWDWSF